MCSEFRSEVGAACLCAAAWRSAIIVNAPPSLARSSSGRAGGECDLRPRHARGSGATDGLVELALDLFELLGEVVDGKIG